MKDVYDVTIIGGGPAGLYSAFYSGLREMKVKIIDVQPELGGKVRLYPEKVIWDVGGMPPTTGDEFRKQLIEQGLRFEPAVHLDTKVTSFERLDDGSFVIYTDKDTHYSKSVIMAAGGGIITPQKLNVTGADRFELTNLHYTIQALDRFKGKKVLVSGGGNAAVDWANELSPIAGEIFHVYRKEEPTGHEAEVARLKKGPVRSFPCTRITELKAGSDGTKIALVVLERDCVTEPFELEVDEVVVSHGYERDMELLQQKKEEIGVSDDGVILGGSDGTTGIPGLFAAGDLLRHDGKLNLIAGAFHDAANAVNQAKQYIDPDAVKYGMVSSHNDRFKDWNEKIKAQRNCTIC
jgi:ferredoxin/flavodoxin---NADP+ reductase